MRVLSVHAIPRARSFKLTVEPSEDDPKVAGLASVRRRSPVFRLFERQRRVVLSASDDESDSRDLGPFVRADDPGSFCTRRSGQSGRSNSQVGWTEWVTGSLWLARQNPWRAIMDSLAKGRPV